MCTFFIEENFSTIQVKLLGVMVCFHPLLLTFLKSLPPDLRFAAQVEPASTEGLLTTASAVNDAGQCVIILLSVCIYVWVCECVYVCVCVCVYV